MIHFIHRFFRRSWLLLLVMLTLGLAKVGDNVPVVPAEAISPPDPLFDKEVSRGIHLTFIDRFEESLAIFDSLVQIYPDHPAPYFFRAATYQNWMSSYRINQFQKEVEENVQSAIDKGTALLKKTPEAWLHFYIGAAYGYRGFNRFRKHNWIGAYRDAQRGIDNFRDALKTDPSLYDVYLGLGSYYYWRTARSKFIRIIAFWMRDKRELGLDQLGFAIRHGRYAPNEASYVLVTALLDAGKYTQALEVLETVIERKEQPNLADLYFKGRIMAHFSRWDEADASFSEVLKRLKTSPYPTVGYQVECQYWLAVSYRERGLLQEALKLARKSLALSQTRKADLELEGYLESFNDIRKELENLEKELAREYAKESN